MILPVLFSVFSIFSTQTGISGSHPKAGAVLLSSGSAKGIAVGAFCIA